MSSMQTQRESTSATPALSGVWLPLVTPFLEGRVDHESAARLTRRFVDAGIDGLILAATTGEGLVLDAEETAGLIETCATAAAGRGPVERKSGVSGKSVSVRVDLRGRGMIYKKNKNKNT